jgi:hypothetical protein
MKQLDVVILGVVGFSVVLIAAHLLVQRVRRVRSRRVALGRAGRASAAMTADLAAHLPTDPPAAASAAVPAAAQPLEGRP